MRSDTSNNDNNGTLTLYSWAHTMQSTSSQDERKGLGSISGHDLYPNVSIWSTIHGTRENTEKKVKIKIKCEYECERE